MRREALYHEQLYRSPDLLRRMQGFAVTICGGGALGGNCVESLARQGFDTLTVIDQDRVEERNLSTQPYYRTDVGAFKAKILANNLYRALGVSINVHAETLTSTNASRLLQGSGLVIDTFDNSVGRQAVQDTCDILNIPCLHVGLAEDFAEILWNARYRVPSAAKDNVCDYPLARNLVLLTVAVACETIAAFVASGRQNSYTITFGDFAVTPFA